MKRIIVLIAVFFIVYGSYAQTKISGSITDANTGEALIGATIIYGKGMGTATDFEGNYSFTIQAGEINLKVSYVGYQEISKTAIVGLTPQVINFNLKTVLLNEVQVVADIAIDRETPVAFSTIPM